MRAWCSMSDIGSRFNLLDVEDLRLAFPEPDRLVATKKRGQLNETARRFIAHSPFVCMATRSTNGADCSPRGDEPGFVRVLDDHLLAIPDRQGNNLADSFRNLVEDPSVGLLFFVPGVIETLRVNGRGYVTDDPQVTKRFQGARLSLLVKVDEAFFHCGKAVLRSELWTVDAVNAEAATLGSNGLSLELCEEPRSDLDMRDLNRVIHDDYATVVQA